MKLLCFGDLHLGAGSDYGRELGERLREQEAVWRRIIELSGEHEVDAILFAGDAFERRRPTPEEITAFERPLLDVLGLPVIAIAGNHDVEAAERVTGLEVLSEARLLTMHRTPTWQYLLGVAVAVLPWTPVARMVAANGGGDRDELHERAAELLLDTARDLRSQILAGQPAILMLHWSVSGASLPTGLPTDTLREPVIPLDELEELGFDAIVCGHIHKSQMMFPPGAITLGSEEHTFIGRGVAFYVGSPMPLNFGEANVAHGVWIIDTEPWSSTFVPIESRPFVTLDDDITAESPDDATDALHADIGLRAGELDGAIVKARYRATSEQARRIDHAEIRQSLLDAGAHKVYAIEATIEREQRARVEGLDEGISPIEALRAYVAANEIDTMAAGQMADRTSAYLQAVES